MEKNTYNTPNNPGKNVAELQPSLSESLDTLPDQIDGDQVNPRESSHDTEVIVPTQTQEQRVEEARSELDEVFESTPDTEDAKRQENRDALNAGLSILNNIPPSTREYLYSKHNLPELMQTLEDMSQKIDVDKVNKDIIRHTLEQIQQIGSPNPNSPIWAEIGRPSSSDMGRIAVRLEEAIGPLLKHLQEISQE